jgi:hypothetical protein
MDIVQYSIEKNCNVATRGISSCNFKERKRGFHLLVTYQMKMDCKATKSDGVTGENRSPSPHENVEKKGKEKGKEKKGNGKGKE